MLSLKNVKIGFGTNIVINDINHYFPASGLFLILGNNGSGKTSLLKTLCSVNKPQSGVIELGEKGVDKMTLMERSSYINYADNPFPLPNFITLDEYIVLGSQDVKSKTLAVMTALQIELLQDQQVNRMSRGQQQKAMLAKLFYGNQPVWLLDEPTNYLDYPSLNNFWNQIQEQSKERLIIATVHNPEEALKLDATILVVNNKQLIELGSHPSLEELVGLLTI